MESISTIRRILEYKAISRTEYNLIKKEIYKDMENYNIIHFDSTVKDFSIYSIDKYQLKTLDSIQLGSALSVKQDFDYFVCSNKKLLNAALKEKLKSINPLKNIVI